MLCPVCGGNYNHFKPPYLKDGGDNYEAKWGGRGDLAVIPMWGECGSQWEVCIGFHKGQNPIFVRVSSSCKAQEQPEAMLHEEPSSPSIGRTVKRYPNSKRHFSILVVSLCTSHCDPQKSLSRHQCPRPTRYKEGHLEKRPAFLLQIPLSDKIRYAATNEDTML